MPAILSYMRLDEAALGLTSWKVGEQIYCTAKAGSSFNGSESVTATNSIMKINLLLLRIKNEMRSCFL